MSVCLYAKSISLCVPLQLISISCCSFASLKRLAAAHLLFEGAGAQVSWVEPGSPEKNIFVTAKCF